MLNLTAGPLIWNGLLFVSSGLLVFLLSVASYWLFFVWQRRRFHPGYRPNVTENRCAIRYALLNNSLNGLFSFAFQYLILAGHGRVYFSIADRGYPYFFFSILLYVFFTETLLYWIHRALHVQPFYRWLHRQHHRFRKPTPLASFAFHPFDSLLQALPHHLCALFLPVHVGVYLLFWGFTPIWTILIHDRISLISWGAINYTGHHTVHHWYHRYNYGQFFTFWDRIAGTYRSPKELPAALAASWLPGERSMSAR
jgi:lathosterol oxidase